MAWYGQSGGEEEFPELCFDKAEREISLASTVLPTTPLLEFEEIVDCFESDFEGTMKDIQSGHGNNPVGGLADELSKSCEVLRQVAGPEEISTALLDAHRSEDNEEAMNQESASPMRLLLAFSLGISSRYLFASCRFSFPSTFVVVVFALMVLPGVYLYVADGCRPEDHEEHLDKSNSGALAFWLMALGLGSIYGVCVSGIFRTLVLCVAGSMLLPGIYLYMVDGCSPEEGADEGGE